VVAAALRRTGALSGDLLSAGEQWTAQLVAFTAALSAATTGALTQIDAAEQSAEEARAATAADNHDRQNATLQTALTDRTADLEQAHIDLKTAGSRVERAETAQQKAHQDAEAARAETGRVREELTAHITRLEEDLVAEREDGA
jgi:chromosome segregation ATPase